MPWAFNATRREVGWRHRPELLEVLCSLLQTCFQELCLELVPGIRPPRFMSPGKGPQLEVVAGPKGVTGAVHVLQGEASGGKASWGRGKPPPRSHRHLPQLPGRLLHGGNLPVHFVTAPLSDKHACVSHPGGAGDWPRCLRTAAAVLTAASLYRGQHHAVKVVRFVEACIVHRDPTMKATLQGIQKSSGATKVACALLAAAGVVVHQLVGRFRRRCRKGAPTESSSSSSKRVGRGADLTP